MPVLENITDQRRTTMELLKSVAVFRYGAFITPPGKKKLFDECFTLDNKSLLLFWFNTPDGNTHIVRERDLESALGKML